MAALSGGVVTEVPETQYASLGEDRIAYQVFGQGDVDVLHVPGGGGCIDLSWDYPPTPISSIGSASGHGSSPSIGVEQEHRIPPPVRRSRAGNSGQTMPGPCSMRLALNGP